MLFLPLPISFLDFSPQSHAIKVSPFVYLCKVACYHQWNLGQRVSFWRSENSLSCPKIVVQVRDERMAFSHPAHGGSRRSGRHLLLHMLKRILFSRDDLDDKVRIRGGGQGKKERADSLLEVRHRKTWTRRYFLTLFSLHRPDLLKTDTYLSSFTCNTRSTLCLGKISAQTSGFRYQVPSHAGQSPPLATRLTRLLALHPTLRRPHVNRPGVK